MEWVGVVGLILSLLAGGYQAFVSEKGGAIDSEALSLANQIAKEIAGNEGLINKLQMAYNQKNNNLINSLFRGAGFGPRAENLRRSLERNEKQMQEDVNKLTKANVNKRQVQGLAETAANLGGTSIKGNIEAKKWIEKANNANHELNKQINLNQNINGGISNV